MSAATTLSAPPAIMPRNLRKIKFLDLDPLELARQLTIKISHFFYRIMPEECLSKAWPRKFGADTPNVTEMIKFNTATTNWVIDAVLFQDDLKRRANVIKHFVTIAEASSPVSLLDESLI